MPDKEQPDHRDLWDAIYQARLEIAKLQGMIDMHFRDGEPPHPPCQPAIDMQKTRLGAAGAALLALLGTIGNIIVTFLR